MKTPALLLPLLLALPALAGSARPPAAQEAPNDSQAEARFEPMLLHLANGTVLRVRAREAPGAPGVAAGWEIRQGRDLVTRLPASGVARAALERDVLAEAKRLAHEVDRKDPVRRTALASWMFEQGLWAEGIDELDPVLGREPDQPEAIALLKRMPPPLALPEVAAEAESVTAFLRQVCAAKPVAREVAVQRLGAACEQQAGASPGESLDLRATLRRELAESSLRRRAFAALALRRLFPGQEIKALLNRAVLDGSSDVRAEAALALRAADDPAVTLPVLRALSSQSSAVRSNAAEALGNMGYPHAVAPLVNHLTTVSALAQSGGGFHAPASHIFVGKQVAYVQDYDVEVAQGASIADPTINTIMEGAVLDVRVLGLSQSQISSERAAVRGALANLTGANPGRTTKAWTSWWDEHGTAWMARFSAPETSAPTTPGG
jgi:hypothetical protein